MRKDIILQDLLYWFAARNPSVPTNWILFNAGRFPRHYKDIAQPLRIAIFTFYWILPLFLFLTFTNCKGGQEHQSRFPALICCSHESEGKVKTLKNNNNNRKTTVFSDPLESNKHEGLTQNPAEPLVCASIPGWNVQFWHSYCTQWAHALHVIFPMHTTTILHEKWKQS